MVNKNIKIITATTKERQRAIIMTGSIEAANKILAERIAESKPKVFRNCKKCKANFLVTHKARLYCEVCIKH